ncbi:MAG: hypothetical protein HQK58_07240 [Deltaproteobacteria bacterium]|nr:hypothetical protein [Deltaproteobacteria bacterium]
MDSLLGARPVFVGFKAGVASALVDLEVNLDTISTALTMEDGVELLSSYKPRWMRPDDTGLEEVGTDLDDADENNEQDDAEAEEERADHGDDAEENDEQDDR